MSEYIYCLKNDAMPGLLKLGFSSNLYKRMKKLFSTGVPMKFECVYLKSVKGMREAESSLFDELSKYRFNSSREFFQLNIKLVKEAFDKIDGKYIDVSEFNKPHNIKSRNLIIKEENQYECINEDMNLDDNDVNLDDNNLNDNDDNNLDDNNLDDNNLDDNNLDDNDVNLDDANIHLLICKRCGYKTDYKPNLKRHLLKKKFVNL
jgi:hypothetical protein